MTRRESCSSCAFSELVTVEGGAALRCHRFPPRVFAYPHEGTVWTYRGQAQVGEGDWCGEWCPTMSEIPAVEMSRWERVRLGWRLATDR